MGRKKQLQLPDLDGSDDRSNKISSATKKIEDSQSKNSIDNKNILSLDVSTSCTGVCILDKNLNLVVLDAVKFPASCITMFDKADRGIEEIKKLVNGRNIDKIFVEANAKMFMPGFSSADTLITLAKFNVLLSYLSHKAFAAQVIDVNVSSARKAVGFKNNKADKRPKKEQVKDYVIALHPEFPYKKHIAKAGRQKNQEVYDSSNGDMIDAWVIAKGGSLLNP